VPRISSNSSLAMQFLEHQNIKFCRAIARVSAKGKRGA
jgi:hypothetical protein